MNINKVLTGLFVFLFLLVAVTTVIRLNFFNDSCVEIVIADDEVLMENVRFAPEIVRSYETVKEVYGLRNILFFRYDKQACKSCIEVYLSELFALQEEIGKEHVWIFPAFPDDRGSGIQLSNELAKYNYRNIPTDSLIIPTIESEKRSYFAWLNSEGEIDMIFIPDFQKKQYNLKFYQEVTKKVKNEE